MDHKTAQETLFDVFELGINDILVNKTESFGDHDFKPLIKATVMRFENCLIVAVDGNSYRITISQS